MKKKTMTSPPHVVVPKSTLDLRAVCVSPSGYQIRVVTQQELRVTYSPQKGRTIERIVFHTRAWPVDAEVPGPLTGLWAVGIVFAGFSRVSKSKKKAIKHHFNTVRLLGEREYTARRVQ